MTTLMIAANGNYNVNIDVENVSNKVNVMIIVFATTFLGTLFLLGHKLLSRCTYESYDSSSLISYYD
jgi:hypothetical protein